MPLLHIKNATPILSKQSNLEKLTHKIVFYKYNRIFRERERNQGDCGIPERRSREDMPQKPLDAVTRITLLCPPKPLFWSCHPARDSAAGICDQTCYVWPAAAPAGSPVGDA